MNSLQEMRNFSICLKVVWFCLFSRCFKNVVENQQCQEAISLSTGAELLRSENDSVMGRVHGSIS